MWQSLLNLCNCFSFLKWTACMYAIHKTSLETSNINFIYEEVQRVNVPLLGFSIAHANASTCICICINWTVWILAVISGEFKYWKKYFPLYRIQLIYARVRSNNLKKGSSVSKYYFETNMLCSCVTS